MICNYVLDLLVNLNNRLVRLEDTNGLLEDDAKVFHQIIRLIEREVENREVNEWISG